MVVFANIYLVPVVSWFLPTNNMIPVNLEREENLFLEAGKELVGFCHCLITLFTLLFKSKTTLYISRKQFLLYQHATPYRKIAKK